jgi:1-acyl-sn-glycerol-3-phosphate acyltransferase
MWQDILTAGVFYMPFVMTIGFALIVFFIGLACIISGTFFLIALANYGIYSILRDTGVLARLSDKMNLAWNYVNKKFVENLHESFVLQNTETIPKTQALYICSPHGLMAYSWFFHFSYCLSKWPEKSPRPLLAVHSMLFRIPFAREILEANRCIEATEEEIEKALNKGHSVAIVIGGVEEMSYSGEKQVKLILKKRKGYIRIAKQKGSPIVPLYAEGENELFQKEPSFLWKTFSDLLYRFTKLQYPLPSWKSIQYISRIVKEPLENPIQTFVLEPIETQNKDERTIQLECITRVQQFLKTHQIDADIIG